MDKRPHALVTGASSGIGAAIVERLLRDGWRVTGISRRLATFDHPALRSLVARPRMMSTALPNAVGRLHADRTGSCAPGLLKVGALGSLDHDDGAAMWRLHVDVAGRLANALAPRLPNGGRIVFIGSRTASGAAGRGQYAATKAALVALARSWAHRARASRHHGQRRCARRNRDADAERSRPAPMSHQNCPRSAASFARRKSRTPWRSCFRRRLRPSPDSSSSSAAAARSEFDPWLLGCCDGSQRESNGPTRLFGLTRDCRGRPSRPAPRRSGASRWDGNGATGTARCSTATTPATCAR